MTASLLENDFLPKTNKWHERCKFGDIIQQDDEKIIAPKAQVPEDGIIFQGYLQKQSLYIM